MTIGGLYHSKNKWVAKVYRRSFEILLSQDCRASGASVLFFFAASRLTFLKMMFAASPLTIPEEVTVIFGIRESFDAENHSYI